VLGAVALLLAGGVAGCGRSAATERTVTVFAAASLRSAFAAEVTAYESAHPGRRVRLSVAGSQTLAEQVAQGAPADVLATADRVTLAAVQDRLVTGPTVLAHNDLAVLTAAGNPLRISGLTDLTRPGLRVAVPGPLVPAGRAAASALLRAGVVLQPLSEPDSVAGVVSTLRLGEADAGIGYVTDAIEGLAATPVPDTRTDLVIGTLTEQGRAFRDFVLSPTGQRILQDHGFAPA
jgi:molybdate transport system substrate-binding protein